MKKTAKTAAIALALTAAASGLTSCSLPWEAAYGAYGPDPNATLTTVSEAVTPQTESVPDKAAKDGTGSSEEDGDKTAESKADKSKSSEDDDSKSAENKSDDKTKSSGNDSPKSADNKSDDKTKSSGSDSPKSAETKSEDNTKSSGNDNLKSAESRSGDSAGSSGSGETSSEEDKPAETAAPDEAPTDGFSVDTEDGDYDTFADEDGIEEYDEIEIATETEDTE